MQRVGIIGCGQISGIYLENLTRKFTDLLRVTACADLNLEAARGRAAEFGVPTVLSVEELLRSPEVDIIANLTIPEAHYELAKAALEEGKHVYSEKPIATNLAQALELQKLAQSRGLMLSCAPDTLLGGAWQNARAAVDSRKIGEPSVVSANCNMRVYSAKYHRAGVGPVLDMGPYYIGALITLLGPVKRVTATGLRAPMAARENAEQFVPHLPSRVSAALELVSGCVAGITFCSDASFYKARFEIFGREGILTCADPNGFGGVVTLNDGKCATILPEEYGFTDNSRGLGIADMAAAARDRRPHRFLPEIAVHTLDVMEGILSSVESGVGQEMITTCERPVPMGRVGGDLFAVR